MNLAARLEAHTREVARGILVDTETRAALGDQLALEWMGEVQFKGKGVAVPMFSVNLKD